MGHHHHWQMTMMAHHPSMSSQHHHQHMATCAQHQHWWMAMMAHHHHLPAYTSAQHHDWRIVMNVHKCLPVPSTTVNERWRGPTTTIDEWQQGPPPSPLMNGNGCSPPLPVCSPSLQHTYVVVIFFLLFIIQIHLHFTCSYINNVCKDIWQLNHQSDKYSVTWHTNGTLNTVIPIGFHLESNGILCPVPFLYIFFSLIL